MFCVYLCLYTYTHAMEVRKVTHPLELALQVDVNHHVSTGNWTQTLWKAASAY